MSKFRKRFESVWCRRPRGRATRKGPVHMQASAHEPIAHKLKEELQTEALFLTPGKVEARTDLRPGVAVSKDIGNCTSSEIAEKAHWAPNSCRLDTAAVAEGEESV